PPPPHTRARTSSNSSSATASAADSPASLPHKAGQETHEFPAVHAKDDRYSAHIRNPHDVPTSTLRSQCHPPKRWRRQFLLQKSRACPARELFVNMNPQAGRGVVQFSIACLRRQRRVIGSCELARRQRSLLLHLLCR